MALRIIGHCDLKKINNALQALEKLCRVYLLRSDKKRIFGDYGKRIMYTCAGVHVSRNSPDVFDYAPYMAQLPKHHLDALMWIMHRAEMYFEKISDHQVVSHIHHAKKALNYKTMCFEHESQTSFSKYYGSIAFGCNIFLRCHTDQDFTMSIVQVFVKGQEKYQIDDDVVAYFCFPMFGVYLPL